MSGINYTPLSPLTLPEFVAHLQNRASPTDEEVEALVRIEHLLDHIEDLERELRDANA